MIIREKNRDVVTDVIVCNSFITPNRCTRDFKSDISPNNPFPLHFTLVNSFTVLFGDYLSNDSMMIQRDHGENFY